MSSDITLNKVQKKEQHCIFSVISCTIKVAHFSTYENHSWGL